MSGPYAEIARLREQVLDLQQRLGRHAGNPSLVDAGHPTAENGQCPICYSEGYEAAEAEIARLKERVKELPEAARDFLGNPNEPFIIRLRAYERLMAALDAIREKALNG